MIDERAFKQANEDGICFIENATNKDEQYMLVRLSKDNKRVGMVGDVLMIDLEKII